MLNLSCENEILLHCLRIKNHYRINDVELSLALKKGSGQMAYKQASLTVALFVSDAFRQLVNLVVNSLCPWVRDVLLRVW